MLLATFVNFFVSKLLTFENLQEEYHLVTVYVDHSSLQSAVSLP